jgi:hypothetical protein
MFAVLINIWAPLLVFTLDVPLADSLTPTIRAVTLYAGLSVGAVIGLVLYVRGRRISALLPPGLEECTFAFQSIETPGELEAIKEKGRRLYRQHYVEPGKAEALRARCEKSCMGLYRNAHGIRELVAYIHFLPMEENAMKQLLANQLKDHEIEPRHVLGYAEAQTSPDIYLYNVLVPVADSDPFREIYRQLLVSSAMELLAKRFVRNGKKRIYTWCINERARASVINEFDFEPVKGSVAERGCWYARDVTRKDLLSGARARRWLRCQVR